MTRTKMRIWDAEFKVRYPKLVSLPNLLFSQYPGIVVAGYDPLFRDHLYFISQFGWPYPDSVDDFATGSDERLAQKFRWSLPGGVIYTPDAHDLMANFCAVLARFREFRPMPEYPGLALRSQAKSPVGKLLNGVSIPGLFYARKPGLEATEQSDGVMGHWELRNVRDQFAPLDPFAKLRKFSPVRAWVNDDADPGKTGWRDVWQDYT